MIKWDDYWKNYSISEAEKWMVELRNEYLNKFIDRIESTEKNVLEVGCGFGSNIKLLKHQRNDIICHALDNSQISIDKVKEEIENVYLADCQDTKLDSEKFDMIFSAGLMEHFYDETAFLKEMKRILKPDGFLITFVPAKISLWQLYQLLHFGNWQHGYEKAYSFRQLIDLFVQKDFLVVDVMGIDPFSFNGFIMKLTRKRIEPIIKNSPIRSGYTELGIVAKKNK